MIFEDSDLPPLYRRWLRESLGGMAPKERLATCNECVMCAPAGTKATSRHFRPDAKCCTYWPRLANFSLGGVLSAGPQQGAEGIDRIRRQIASSGTATPLGLERPLSQQVLFGNLGADAFGKSKDLLCPYFVSGKNLCSIYEHRNGVCSTWFCKYERGQLGLQFWQQLNELLGAVEVELAHWCVLELGLDSKALRRLLFTATNPGGTHPGRNSEGADEQDTRKQLWGQWFAREEEFYVECHRRVSAMTWKDVQTVAGVRSQLIERLVLDSFAGLREPRPIPSRLRLGSFTMNPANDRGFELSTYSVYDGRRISRAVFELLPRFDGREVTEVLAEIESTGVALDEALIQLLWDLQILVPADPAKEEVGG